MYKTCASENYVLWTHDCILFSLAVSFCISDSIYHTFKFCWTMMFICQILTVVEVINPALGLVNTAIFPAMVQVIKSLVSLVCFLGLFTE